MLKRVHITNFKSLADVVVDLEPLTVLIGRSGTGKTNFVDCAACPTGGAAYQTAGGRSAAARWLAANVVRLPFSVSSMFL